MKTANIILFSLLTAAMCFLGYTHLTAPKYGWVDVQMLYQKFEYRKEVEQKYNEVKKYRTAILDSLELDLKAMAKELELSKEKQKTQLEFFATKREDYFRKKNAFEEDNNMMAKKYNEQVLNQLNQYVKAYGAKYGYRYIYGADGSGSLMYAEKADDITEEVSHYVNESYKGKN